MNAQFSIKNNDKIFIDGEWVDASGKGFELINPHTGEAFCRVAEASEQDVDKAVSAARAAFDRGDWREWSLADRANALRKLSAMLQERSRELEAVFTAQVGGLSSFAPMAVGGALATLASYGDIAENYTWETGGDSSLPGHYARVIREPVGVVAAISPWNMPLSIMVQKIAPALAAGCTVIMKPSPETPLEAYIIAEVAAEVLPPGVLNLLPADREASDYLVRHPGVDKISFTGSTLAGKRIASVAGERMARVTLELGGKSPAIVTDDFPIDEAAEILARGSTILCGQVCALLSRVIVSESRHDALAEAIARVMSTVKIGDPSDPTTEMGPIAMARQLERVRGYVDLGQQEGARLVCGGKSPTHMKEGFYFEPTLFANVDNKMRIAQEEIFGPVLCLIPAQDTQHAISLANDTPYGLNASVLSHNADKVYRIARQIRSGNIAQNGLKADFTLPFGGFKQSGIGREGGAEGIAPYTETKTLITVTP